jgi:tetratricopeptide (TPR) repeat protein
VRTAVSIYLLLVLGIAFDSSRAAAEVISLSQGTGFFVSKDGRLLTNFHVINSCRHLTVQSGRLSSAARVVATDTANDIALLATNLKPVRTADWRYSVRDDEPVVVYGFPPTGARAADGNALGLTGWRHNKLLFWEAGVEPGMSGSAIMDGSGLVIGINVGDIGHVMGRGTGSTAAAALLDAHGVAHPEARGATPLSKSEIIERAKVISVKVTCQLDGRSTDERVCLKSGGASVPDDKIIDACNREIPSGRFSGEVLRIMYVQRAASHLNKHHIDLALRDCDEAAKIAEDSDNFRCRARIYATMGALGRAITEWDEAVRVFPKDIIALSGRGGSFLARNDLAHAMADLEKAVEIDPEFANALWLRGAVHDKMRQHDRAVADFDRAIAIYDKLLKLYSVPLLRADMLAERANAYNAKGERNRAVADYDQAIALVPNRVSLIASRANVLNASNDRDRAIADLDRVIRLEPTNPRGFNDRGNIHSAKGDQDRAIADYDQAIRLNPKYALAFRNRGLVYSAKGDNDRAIADYDEAIRLDPRDALAFNNRGMAYHAKGDDDRAIADYDEAIGLNPNYAAAFRNRGLARRAKRDNDRAIADYDEAIRLDPKYATAFNGRGIVHRAKGDNDRAIADYDMAIRLEPKYPAALNNRGLAYFGKGDNDRAIADYNDAIRLNPKYALAFSNRGLAYRATGDNDHAIADYDEAIRLDPKFTTAFKQRGRLFFYNGDFERAAADLLRANELKEDAYALLWRYLARGRMGQDGTAELSANATRLKTKDWPYAVIEFYLGLLSLVEMQAAAGNPNDKCESAFYAGEWKLLHRDEADAKASLQLAADTCPKALVEYDGAISELKRLGQ